MILENPAGSRTNGDVDRLEIVMSKEVDLARYQGSDEVSAGTLSKMRRWRRQISISKSALMRTIAVPVSRLLFRSPGGTQQAAQGRVSGPLWRSYCLFPVLADHL